VKEAVNERLIVLSIYNILALLCMQTLASKREGVKEALIETKIKRKY